MSRATQRNTPEAMEWGTTHRTTAQIGFNPNGMCQAVTRIDRNIGPRYPSALSSALATPKEHRIYSVKDMKRGHVLYLDDPNDSNPYGHVVPIHGRVKDADPNDLGGLIVLTNSVKSGERVFVRGDYFKRYWGDSTMFAADWMNGEPFYDMVDKPVKPKKPIKTPNLVDSIESIEEGISELRTTISNLEMEYPRYARALRRDLRKQKDVLRDLKRLYNERPKKK